MTLAIDISQFEDVTNREKLGFRDELTAMGYKPMTKWQVLAKRWQHMPFLGQLLSYIPEGLLCIVALATIIGGFSGMGGVVVSFYEAIFGVFDSSSMFSASVLTFACAAFLPVLEFALDKRIEWRRVRYYDTEEMEGFGGMLIKIPAHVQKIANDVYHAFPGAKIFIEYAHEDPFLVIERDGEYVYLAHWV